MIRVLGNRTWNGGLVPASAALFVLLLAAYAFSVDLRASRGASITGDEPFYLLTTQSLLQDGDLDLSQQYARRSYESFFDHPDGLWRQSAPTPAGRLLSPHNPGLSVLLIPGFTLGGLRGAQAQLVVLAALTFALAFVLTARVIGTAKVSWLVAGAVGLSPTAFVYASEVYPEVPAALALVAALLILAYRRAPGPWAAAALAVVLSTMPWLGIKYAPLVVVVGAYALWRGTLSGRATFLALGVVSAVAYAWFHLHTFGALTPYSVGLVYAGDATVEVVERHVVFVDRIYRLWGLFVDERFGVGRWAPFLLLAIPGLVMLWRAGALARLLVGLVAVQLLMATFVHITMMGWWFPGRTLMVVLPLLAVAIAPVARAARGRRVWGVGALAAYSLAVTATLALAARRGEVTLAVDPFDLSAALFQKMAWLFPNYTWWDGETWMVTVAWIVGIAAAIAGGMGMLPMRLPGRDARSTPLPPAPAQTTASGRRARTSGPDASQTPSASR